MVHRRGDFRLQAVRTHLYGLHTRTRYNSITSSMYLLAFGVAFRCVLHCTKICKSQSGFGHAQLSHPFSVIYAAMLELLLLLLPSSFALLGDVIVAAHNLCFAFDFVICAPFHRRNKSADCILDFSVGIALKFGSGWGESFDITNVYTNKMNAQCINADGQPSAHVL